jgi:CheY-like chemotaxis protein/HPt (histidine-containing phosphotransfer) domain-containing protein
MKKIAVVEDNPDNRLLVQVILEPQYEITEYENGFTALEGLPKHKPDLVLLDVSLPEMDGTEVLQRIRANEQLRDLPVIALTAHAMTGDREKFLGAGFDDYVTKPIVDEALLLDAIQKLLAEPRKSRPVAMAESPHLNPAALERLHRLGGAEFVGKMIALFLSYTAEKIAGARAAQVAGDLGGVAKAVHPIKSSAGNVGATRVQELAQRLEALAQQGPSAAVTALVGELEQAFLAVKPELERRQKALAKPTP